MTDTVHTLGAAAARQLANTTKTQFTLLEVEKIVKEATAKKKR